jgi:hypothetical protein
MQRIEPKALTNEELLNHIYAQNYNVSVAFVKELSERFTEMQDIAQGILDMGTDPRQLELPL